MAQRISGSGLHGAAPLRLGAFEIVNGGEVTVDEGRVGEQPQALAHLLDEAERQITAGEVYDLDDIILRSIISRRRRCGCLAV